LCEHVNVAAAEAAQRGAVIDTLRARCGRDDEAAHTDSDWVRDVKMGQTS